MTNTESVHGRKKRSQRVWVISGFLLINERNQQAESEDLYRLTPSSESSSRFIRICCRRRPLRSTAVLVVRSLTRSPLLLLPPPPPLSQSVGTFEAQSPSPASRHSSSVPFVCPLTQPARGRRPIAASVRPSVRRHRLAALQRVKGACRRRAG